MDEGQTVRLAVLGMVPGNGHPYSWSAIVNGYDADRLPACPYETIRGYLSAHPPAAVGIPGARVTHLWTDNPADARSVAAFARVDTIVDRPEEVIGRVDAVLVATDDGDGHVRRARPFVESGLPVFIDKPLATNLEDLRTFIRWERSGAAILSSSGLRYAPEIDRHAVGAGPLGPLRWVTSLTTNTWGRYGIHALEPVFRVLGPGFASVRLEAAPGLEVAHLRHCSGTEVIIPAVEGGASLFGTIHLCGRDGQEVVRLENTYEAFRRQLVNFVGFARSGKPPYPFSETIELMAVIIAGLTSGREGARRVSIGEIMARLQTPS